MSLEELIMICDQLPKLERVALHGIGEPILNKDLPNMIRHLKERKAFVFFNSNGILLDEMCQNQLIDAGLDELRVSLDASTPTGYKNVRNSDQFNLIVDNLRAFSERIMRVLKLQNGQVLSSMLPDLTTRLKVCKQAA